MGDFIKKMIFIFIIMFLVVSCSMFDESEEDSFVECEEIPPLQATVFDSEKRYYIVLVEGSEEYLPYREQGLTVLTSVFEAVLEPADHIVAIWMEVSNLGSDNAVFFTTDFNETELKKNIPEPLPSLIPTPTPLSEGVTPSSRIQHDNETNRINELNEEVIEDYYCKNVRPVREENNNNIKEWNDSNKNEVKRINDEFTKSTTTSNLDYMSVYEALKLASDIFEDNCSKGDYKDCQLIIVSNLVDWRSNLESAEILSSIEEMNINFSNVSVAVIWPDCQFFSDQFKSQCESRKDTWSKNFYNFQASEEKGNLIFVNMDNAINKLEKFIGD